MSFFTNGICNEGCAMGLSGGCCVQHKVEVSVTKDDIHRVYLN